MREELEEQRAILEQEKPLDEIDRIAAKIQSDKAYPFTLAY